MGNVGAVSNTIGGGAFLVLSILLATSWRGRLRGGVVVAATCISAIWCFWLAYEAKLPSSYPTLTLLLEVLRGGAWLCLLLTLLSGYYHSRVAFRLFAYVIGGFCLLALLCGAAVVLGLHADYPIEFVAPLAIALVGLTLLEQLYRNTPPEKRWAIKFLVLGIGAIFVYDLFLYSQALLFREITIALWNARGAVNALAVPLIAVAAARNPEWSINVFVSRQVVFYTTVLIGAGIYLLAIAAGGYYIELYGGTWGTFAQAVFLGGAALTLAVIMLSADVRAKVKVFLVKHFYKNKYDYRIEWLRLMHTLTTPEEDTPLRERAVQALAQLVESPGGGLWLQQDRTQFVPAARWGSEVPRQSSEATDSPLTQFLQSREWIIDLVQWRGDPSQYENLPLSDWLASQPRTWLLIPLRQETQVLGFVVLMRSQTFGELTWEDTDLLKTVGRQVASYLAQQEAAQQLVQARQFDAYHRLTAFIMHDLKNLIAQQSMVVQNAARHKNNPAFIEDAIRTIDNSVTRMNQLLDQLKRGQSHDRPKRVLLRDVVTESIARQGAMQPAPEFQVQEDGIVVLADPHALASVFGHVLRNAQEATTHDGRVLVRLRQESATAIVEVEDDGVGMDHTFVSERLFRPFDSTKGSKGMGIGAYQVREFVRAAGGDVHVSSVPGKGTIFRIALPALSRQPVGQPLPAIEQHQ